MKKKRFYNNKKRGQKWTEEVRGRKINFADKYVDADLGSNKFDNKRPTVRKPVFTKDNLLKLVKRLIVAVLCVCIIGVGYTIMDVNIQRNRMPDDLGLEDSVADINEVEVRINAREIIPLSMDGGIMLDSVINELLQDRYACALFDLKRSDGTIGYHSRLATIEAFGATSSPANDLKGSITLMKDNDILPVARICCYKDNIAPSADSSIALKKSGKIYHDDGSNTYLDPNSEFAYSYIREIVQEAADMGVSVFVLDYCELPDSLDGDYNDGFEALSKRLYKDVSSNIKLTEAKRITVNGKSARAIDKELEEKLSDKGKNTVYYITAKNETAVKEALDKLGNVNYIIAQ